MVPAYRPGDRLLVARGAASVSAGDVVVFTGGRRGPTGQVVKRVAAVPGDLVPVSVLSAVGARTGQVVPPGRLVVLGDGVTSVDSREFGYLPAARLTGRVLRKLG
jgi:signal peptidase I